MTYAVAANGLVDNPLPSGHSGRRPRRRSALRSPSSPSILYQQLESTDEEDAPPASTALFYNSCPSFYTLNNNPHTLFPFYPQGHLQIQALHMHSLTRYATTYDLSVRSMYKQSQQSCLDMVCSVLFQAVACFAFLRYVERLQHRSVTGSGQCRNLQDKVAQPSTLS